MCEIFHLPVLALASNTNMYAGTQWTNTSYNPLDQTLRNTGKLGALPVVVPNTIKFHVPRQGPPGTRKEFRMSSVASTYSTNTDNIVRFYFNNSNVIDFTRGGIAFDLTITAPGATYVRAAQGVWSIFNRVRLTTGQELEDVREYGRLHSILYETGKTPQVGAQIGSVIGYGTQAQRNTWGATANKDYIMPLMCGLFLSSPLPMGIFSQQLQLEMYLENPLRCIETDSAGPISFSLTSIYFHYEELILSPGVTRQMMGAASAGVRFPYKSFIFYSQPVIAANQDIIIPHASTAIDGFINVMVENDNMLTTTVNDKYLTWLINGCQQFVLRINNEFFPKEPAQVANDPQAYLMFLRWVNKWELGGHYDKPPQFSFDDFNCTTGISRFIIINQLEVYPNSGLVNQLSTNEGGNNVFLRLYLSGAPPVPTSLLTYAVVSKTIDLVGSRLHQ